MTDTGPLISVAGLRRMAESGKVCIVDCTYPLPIEKRDARREFEAAHIPGARFLDLADVSDPQAGLPTMLPTAQRFQEAVRALGLDAGDAVVAYDSHGIRTAPRLWWMFRSFGHARVAVLDGGLPAWRAAGLPTESGRPAPAGPGNWRAAFDGKRLAGLEEVRAAAADPAVQVVDARSADRFRGDAPEPRPGLRAGHIPGSINLPFESLLDPRTHTYLPDEELAAAMRRHGARLGRQARFVCSCGSGVSACVVALALEKLGERFVQVYDGSWAQWGGDASLPIETGAAPAVAQRQEVRR